MIHQAIFDNFAKENAMELDRYRALVCAIETGSLSAAAEALQYTPSGVSRMVAALEEETGVPLLLREHSGVRPTKECEKLLPAIRDLLHAGESCAQLSAQLRGLDVGTVTVGTAYSAFYSPLARIILDFHARYGGIQVQLRGGYSTELITQLNAHQLDLCFISAREGGHDWLPIGYDELTAWAPTAHPMAWLPALPVAAFDKEPYIETYPDKDIDNARVFARCGITPNLKFSTMDSLATYSMVEAGLALAMNNALNGRAWSGGVRILPLDPPQIVEIGAATLPDLSPAARTFLDFLEPHLVEFLSEKS